MPSAVPSATNFAGASIAATAAPLDADSVGVAETSVEALGSADAVAVGIGAASSSSLVDDCDQTTKANSAIPTITAITTRLEAPCCGLVTAAAGRAGAVGATGAEARGADEVTGTAGTLTVVAEDLLAAAFLATRFFGAAFLATAFFAAFFTVLS